MSKALEEKKNELITRAEEVLGEAKAQERELTPDEAAELAEIRDNVRKIVETLGLEEDIERLTQKKQEEPAQEEMLESSKEERSMEEKEIMEYRAFDAYIRGTVNERSGELTPSSGSGQAIIPETIARKIVAKVYDIAPVLQRSTRYNVGGTLEIPQYGETSGHDNITVAYASEFSGLDSHSGAFTTISLGGFVVGALTKISRKLINNAAFDVVGFVVDRMAYEIARFIEKEILNRGDSDHVVGLSSVTQSVTAAAANAITLNEIIELHDKVKDDFQQNAIWVMNPATRTALRELKSTTGYPLLNDDISSPFGTTLLGKPVYCSDNMPVMNSGAVTIYYGDFSGLATKFAEDINIEVLRERYADEHAYGVIGWFEFDTNVENQQKLAKLVMGTTSVG